MDRRPIEEIYRRKQGLVTSAYKPHGNFEKCFEFLTQTEEGLWDFIQTHLTYLSVIKNLGNDLIVIPERDPWILYDQVIAYYVRKGYDVPIDSQDFQLGYSQRFSEHDGMYFLPEQVAEYDRKEMIVGGRLCSNCLFPMRHTQLNDCVTSCLINCKGFQDINTQFMKKVTAVGTKMMLPWNYLH